MSNIEIPLARTLGIRECGYDELWLQQRIVDNPNCLGLGDLEVFSREKRQATGGRLDLLLNDPEDDSMYEVEVMLGETDESHIIRTIEYWDNMKRKWPQRQHTAVLVAESITRRFFNVIHLLSNAIPIVGVRANIIEVNGQKSLSFAKVIDTYEEPEDKGPAADEVHDESYWRKVSTPTTETAKYLFDLVGPVYKESQLKYVKYYISIQVRGYVYWWVSTRSNNKSLVGVYLHEKQITKAKELLDKGGIAYTVKKNQEIRIVTDKAAMENHAEVYKELADMAKQYWEED